MLRLKLSKFKLNAILDITRSINENLPTEELLTIFLKLLRKDLNIGNVVIYSNNGEKWECILASGFHTRIHEIISVEKHLSQFSDITSLTSSRNTMLSFFDVVIPVFHKDRPLAYVLIGDIEEERDGISPTIKHLHFIQTLANIIIVAIENKRLYKETVKQQVMKRELELASKMQTMLIPTNAALPNNEHVMSATYYQPHFEVGGDYYDFIKLSDEEFGFCIADVSGKGISAALLMSNFQANLRALFTSDTSLPKLVKILNDRIVNITGGEKFITIFLAKYNYRKKELVYINAGHNPPILFIDENKPLQYLTKGCTGLGMFDEIPIISRGIVKIIPGMKLLCYTDGLVEVQNEDEVEFSTAHLEKCMNSGANISRIIENIVSQLNIHSSTDTYFDDISIIGIEFLD